MDQRFNPKVADKARQLIGEYIKERRKERGWSLQHLADQAGVRKQTLFDMEGGRNYEINTLIAVVGCLRGELQIIWKDPESVPGFQAPSKN